MDAVKFIIERGRMCKWHGYSCDKCVLNGTCSLVEEDEQARLSVEAVEKWSKEHPQKTYLMKFKEMFPDARLDSCGYPEFSPCDLWRIALEECENSPCCGGWYCWNLACEEGKP